MATGRNLTVELSGVLAAVYSRTDNDLNTSNIKDIFNYSGMRDRLENGVESDQADLMYHAVRQYLTAGGTETIDLDAGDLSNIFGDELRFEEIRCILIKNKTIGADQTKILIVSFQDEEYSIGPQGIRLLWEPAGMYGPSDSPGLAGILSLLSAYDIEYDLIVIGCSDITNPISSGS